MTDDPFTTQLGIGHVVAYRLFGCEAGGVQEPAQAPCEPESVSGSRPRLKLTQLVRPEITKRCSAPHDNLRQ